jgi:glycosyltransferase involved in cell wall biosynthesis
MDKHLKIAIVSETFFPQVNGVSRTLDRLVAHLREQGHRIHLLIPDYGEESPVERDGVGVTRFKGWRLPNYPEILLPLVRPATIQKHLWQFAPDLVHIATEGPLGWAALRAAGRLRMPVVSSYHTNFAQYMESYRLRAAAGLAWKYLRRFHNATLKTFCPTPSIREALLEQGFERVAVWGRGVDSRWFDPAKRSGQMREAFGFAEDEVVFLYCGRLAAEKNLGVLVEAFHSLNQPKARLLMIGDGPLMERLKADCDDRTVFAGYRHGEELARLYAAADVMAFPSLSETFGNVILEAMASGLPVVGFEVPGPKDIIQHGWTGELVPAVSAEALAASMRRLCADAGYRRVLGGRARLHAEMQSWARINGVVSDGYAECLAAGSSAPVQPGPRKGLQPLC